MRRTRKSKSCGSGSIAWKARSVNSRSIHVRLGRPYAAVLIAIAWIFADGASAEFHVWRDDQGGKHISNVPAQGFIGDGDIRSTYDPNSIVYQHARLLDTLAAQGEAIARRHEQERRGFEIEQRPRQTPVDRSAPREGVMNLDELIALEKRGGSMAR
jgi:hypothetical protein